MTIPQPYHKFVFDIENRRFVGDFETMYSREDAENFDSWFQDDMNHLTKRLVLALLSQYNFDKILDFGCGKGTFTHLLKKSNNIVTGIDISKTAISKAIAKYPDIEFLAADAEFFKNATMVDLVVALEVFSYLENWKEVLKDIANSCKYFILSLYLPPNPIGFVKTLEELEENLKQYFEIESKLVANNESVILFVKSLIC